MAQQSSSSSSPSTSSSTSSPASSASPSSSSAAGKVIVITGATSGLGQAAAQAFAKDGARVIVVGRDAARAEETRAAIAAAGGAVDVVLGDVATRAGVDAVAAAVRALTPRIDVLINNAGGTFKALSLTSDGYEQTFALNVLAAFALERALHDLLIGGRVVNLATGFLDRFPLNADALATPARSTTRQRREHGNNSPTPEERGFGEFESMPQYGRAKLAAVMMTVEQAQHFPDVSYVSLHPGIIMGTRFGGGQPRAVQLLIGPLLRAVGLAVTLERAVDFFRSAALGPHQSGVYVVDGAAAARLPKQANDAHVRAQVWALLERCWAGPVDGAVRAAA